MQYGTKIWIVTKVQQYFLFFGLIATGYENNKQ
jgi:hypothetical protein